MKKQHAVARAIAAAMIASTLLAGLANASGPAAKAKEKGETEEGASTSARSMDAPYLAVPVVRDGQLVNYLFVSIRIEITQRRRSLAHARAGAFPARCIGPRQPRERPRGPERFQRLE